MIGEFYTIDFSCTFPSKCLKCLSTGLKRSSPGMHSLVGAFL